MTRRSSSAVLCCGIAFLAGCNAGHDIGNVVQVGSTKAGLIGPPLEYAAMHPRLEEAFGMPVQFNAQPSGKALGQQLAMGNIKYAFMTCAEYCDVENPQDLTLLATAVNAAGRTSRKALIVAKKSDSRFKGIPDCRGKRFAFGTFGDVLTDKAAKRALDKGGCPPKDILLDVITPPFSFLGRLYMGRKAPETISFDPTVNAGVIDEIQFAALPESGGNLITGASKDLLKPLGETDAIPEMVVVAGPNADPELTAKLTDFLMTRVKDDRKICEQLEVKGFVSADPAAYDAVRQWLSKMPPEEVPAEGAGTTKGETGESGT